MAALQYFTGKKMQVPPELIEYEICHRVWPGTTPAQVRATDQVTVMRHWMIYQQDLTAQAMRAGAWTHKRQMKGGKRGAGND